MEQSAGPVQRRRVRGFSFAARNCPWVSTCRKVMDPLCSLKSLSYGDMRCGRGLACSEQNRRSGVFVGLAMWNSGGGEGASACIRSPGAFWKETFANTTASPWDLSQGHLLCMVRAPTKIKEQGRERVPGNEITLEAGLSDSANKSVSHSDHLICPLRGVAR